jgi:hypothetical protein
MAASTLRVRQGSNKSARRRRGPLRAARLELERLEERQMLAASASLPSQQIATASLVSALETNVLFQQPAATGLSSDVSTSVLVRPPGAPALASYTNLLNTGKLSLGQALAAVVASPDYQALVAPTVNLNLTLLGTPPGIRTEAIDEARLASGALTPVELAQQILDSPAFAARHPQMATQDNSAFVTGLYRLAFNRAPDSAELALWTTKLAQGTSRSTMAASLVSSPEYHLQLVHQDQDIVDAAYHLFLDSTPDRGFAQHVSAMVAGQTPSGLASAFVNSRGVNVEDAYLPAAPLGTQTQVTGASPHFQGDPSIAAFANGNYVVAWDVDLEVSDKLPGDPAEPGIFAQLYDKSGHKLGGVIDVSQDDPAAGYYQPEVATDGTSKFIVTWAEQVPQGGDIKSQLFNLNGSPLGNENVVAGPVDAPIDENQVAMNRRGDSVIVWSQEIGNTGIPGVFGQVYTAAGQSLRGTFRIDAGGGDRPSVAMDNAGGFVVSWESKDLANATRPAELFARRFNSAGSPQGAQWQVSRQATGTAGDSSVAVSPDGRTILVAWDSAKGAGYDILARSYTAGGTAADRPFLVNATQGEELAPAVAFDRSRAEFVVAWDDQGSGGATAILAQRYNLSLVPQGNEMVVSTNTTRSKSAPAVAADGQGNLDVAWSALLEGGSEDNVYTQREALAREYVLKRFSRAANPPPAANHFPMMCVTNVGSTADPSGGVRFVILGDYGWSNAGYANINDMQPVDYVGAFIRNTLKPDFIVGLGDTDYLFGKYNWYDQNVGKNYAPYIYPYDYGSGDAKYNQYANARPNTPPKTYNRFFEVPGNHDLGLVEGSHVPQWTDKAFVEAIDRKSYDKFWGPATRRSPAVTPVAGSYYNQYPYNYNAPSSITSFYPIDYRSDQYYDYLLHPINSSGKVMKNLANIYMVDADLSGEPTSDGTYFSKKDSPQAESILALAKTDPNGAPWQFFASHYEPYSSSKGEPGGIANMQWNFAGSGIQVVLAGHVHDYERLEKKDGVTYMVQGAGGFDAQHFQSILGTPFDPFGTPLPGSVARSTGWGATLVTMTPTSCTFQTYMGGDENNDLDPICFQLVDQFTLTK